jgi:hypothetical protein
VSDAPCGRRLARAQLAAATLALVALVGSAPAQAQTPAPCGPATIPVRDEVAYRTAHAIYQDELASLEVTQDSTRVAQSSDLIRAVADDDAPAALAAVTRLVYTPLWHIVRLRVLTRSGRVLADVGGPDVLAPVSGGLFSGSQLVGSFVLSVQDDVGYQKLVTGIAGVPVELYAQGAPLVGSWVDPPSSPPPSGPLIIDGRHYHVSAYDLTAFPTGTLRAAVLVRTPPAAAAAQSCPAVALSAVAGIVTRISVQFGPDSLNPLPEHTFLYVKTALPFVYGPIFILSPDGAELAGTNELPGSTDPAPAALPTSGPTLYNGRNWLVFSFSPDPQLTVYVLQPT